MRAYSFWDKVADFCVLATILLGSLYAFVLAREPGHAWAYPLAVVSVVALFRFLMAYDRSG